jgi:hypothetical protein
MRALIILLITCTAVVAQSRDDLKKKYGEPIAETFVIRPGITVTASHDATGRVTELLIAPQLPDLIKTRSKGLSYETAKGLVDELLPEAARGRGAFAGFLNIGCMPQNDCYGSFSDYEKVSIYYNAGRQRDVNYVVIRWKQ